MFSLNSLIESSLISKNTPILFFTTTAAMVLFFIGSLILSLTGLGLITTTGYVAGTVVIFLGLIGLALLFCCLLKKKKLSTAPQGLQIDTPSPRRILTSEKIKSRKFDISQFSVDLKQIQKTLEVPTKDFREFDLENQQPFFYLLEKLQDRISSYLKRNLISEEKIIKEEGVWLTSSYSGPFEAFKLRINTIKDWNQSTNSTNRVSAFYLLELSKKMEEGILSEEVCIEICESLLYSAMHCASAGVEVSERQYYRHCLGTNDVERNLHTNLNEIKKNICEACLFTCTETQPGVGPIRDVLHLYNSVATSDLGKIWGLTSLGTFTDGMKLRISHDTLDKLSMEFKKLSNPEFLINSMQSQISLMPYNVVYYDTLVSLIKPEELQPNQNPEDFVAEHFYEDYLLNKEGVTQLLLSLGWLVNPIKQ